MLEWDAKTVEKAGETLKNYAIVNQYPKIDEGETDSEGKITFAGLEKGLYLVYGDNLKVEESTYIPSAIFFEVTSEENEYLNAYPKIILKVYDGYDGRYEVKKVWLNDENQPWARDTSITAEVYKDGVLFKEIELNESNGWAGEWNDDDEFHEYIVIEKDIPVNYTVSYEDNKWQYLIINTYDETSNSETQTTTTNDIVTSNAESGKDMHTNSSDETRVTAVINEVTTPKDSTVKTEKLPQTGQLWWPVVPLGIGGLVMIGIGLKLLNKREDSEE